MIFLKPIGLDQYSKISLLIKSTENLIHEVAKGVFSAITEYSKETLPSLAIMSVQVFYPACFFFLTDFQFLVLSTCFTPLPLVILIAFPAKDASQVCHYAQMLAAAAVVLELALSIIFPPSLIIHVAVQGIVISASLLGNMNAIKKGIIKLQEGLSDSTLKINEKVSKVVYGLISIGFGAVGSFATVKMGARLYRGVNKYLTLDARQQKFALKYHAIENLGEVKTQKAILIDGLNGDWAKSRNYYFDNQPDPAGLVIFNYYETRAYHVNSSAELKSFLEQTSKELGGNLDLVAFFGHSNYEHMRLGPNYDFYGTEKELNAIKRHISPNGAILLWGCETAKDMYRNSSIARYISRCLPSHIVTGFAENLIPAQSWSWFDGKKIQFCTWSKTREITRHFLNGINVTTTV